MCGVYLVLKCIDYVTMIFVCICIGCVKIQLEMKGLLWSMCVCLAAVDRSWCTLVYSEQCNIHTVMEQCMCWSCVHILLHCCVSGQYICRCVVS